MPQFHGLDIFGNLGLEPNCLTKLKKTKMVHLYMRPYSGDKICHAMVFLSNDEKQL